MMKFIAFSVKRGPRHVIDYSNFLFEKLPVVKRLALHLSNKQQVEYPNNNPEETLMPLNLRVKLL